MKKILLLAFIFGSMALYSQDDILDELGSLSEPTTNITSATFKATRIITAQSIENTRYGELEFRIAHRFGRLNSGVDNLFGLDQSNIYFDLEYGVTNWLELGLGRTPYEKTVNGYTKIKLLKQSSGKDAMPFALSYFGSIALNSEKWKDETRTNYFSSRMTFTNQLLIAKKINDELSLQLMPTVIHRNLTPDALTKNDVFAMGIGGRFKLNKRTSFNFEYFYVLQPNWNNIEITAKDPLSFGFDIETGGHVFQIMLSNSFGSIEKHYIADNTGSWAKGDIHLGFNISRPFTIIGE